MSNPATGAGDDLDDGLDLDNNLLASSDVGSDVGDEDEEMEEGGEEAVYVSEEEVEVPVVVGKKRKAGEDGEGAAAEKKARKEERRRLKEESTVQPYQLSTEALYDYFYQSLRKTYAKASELEMSELKLPTNAVISTSAYTGERSLETLPGFIKGQLPALPNKIKKNGTPSLLILSLSGMRCADLVRSLRILAPKGVGGIAKLFGKDKIKDQIEHLENTKIMIAVGTPGRVAKILATSDALHIRQQTIILLDLTFQDAKKRTLLTIPEIRDEMWRGFLGDKVVRGKVLAPGVRLGVF